LCHSVSYRWGVEAKARNRSKMRIQTPLSV
jgi:hypothetical protein